MEGRNAIPDLKEKLNDKDPLVKIRAAGELMNMGSGAGMPILKEALKNPEPIIKAYAAATLGKETDLDAFFKSMRENLKNSSDYVKIASAATLYKIADLVEQVLNKKSNKVL
jgi:HEAT repeat protein